MSLNLGAGGFLTWQNRLDPHWGMATEREAKAPVAFINSDSSAGKKKKKVNVKSEPNKDLVLVAFPSPSEAH